MNVLRRCRQWLQSRTSVPQPSDVLRRELARWQNSPAGKAILAQERGSIDDALAMRFGYHLCQYSIFGGIDLTSNSRISHKFRLLPPSFKRANNLREEGVPFDGEQLPLEPESVDVIVLHHCLEFSQQPHLLLREAERVLIANGHLIITVFNPFSFMGLYAQIGRFLHRNGIWRRRAVSASSMFDWLKLLGIQPTELKSHFYRPPIASQATLERLTWFERLAKKSGGLNWGASYTIVARKDVVAMTPLKPNWNTVAEPNKLAGVAVSRQPRLVIVPSPQNRKAGKLTPGE